MIRDFFGNEIEVGDEIALLRSDIVGSDIVSSGIVTQITKEGYVVCNIPYPVHATCSREVFVNVEKKYKEKAVEYHLSQMD